MAHEFLRGCHHLIANHRHTATACLQFDDEFGNTVIGARSVERMLHIVLAEHHKGIFELRVLCTIGHSTLHEQTHTIAHEMADSVERVFGHAVMAQSIVHAVGQVLQSVEQSAVEVEDINVKH